MTELEQENINLRKGNPMVPTLGRIVIHRGISSNGGKDHPAIVTRVWDETCVNLTVFPDCSPPDNGQTSVLMIDPTDENAYGWYWPPRVAECV